MSSISSLGIGSGVLTSDVIDQLKEADESRVVKPVENKLELDSKKQKAFGLVSTYMNTLKASVSSLSYDTIFDNKNVDVSGDAKVTVSSGANIASFKLETTTLAKKDITEFGSLTSKDAKVAKVVKVDDGGDGKGDGVYTITVGAGTDNEKSYDIAYDENTTLSDFAQSITDIAGKDVSASILETTDGEFNLVLSSVSTGADQALSFSDSSGGHIVDQFKSYDADTNTKGYKNIQEAADAEFKYNDIVITRSTNEIDDLVLGVNITLTKEGDVSNIDISQNNTDLVSEMENFVKNYNTLITNLNDMTIYDKESGARGVFQGDSFIKGIGRDMTSSIMKVKNGSSLVDYGISISRSGSMSFDKTAFEAKLNDDPDAVKQFFTGGTDSNGNEVDGFFVDLNEKMKSYTGYGKQLSSYESSLKADVKNLEKQKLSAQETLDMRYAIMSKRFASYDSMISRANASFSSLNMMIQAETHSG